MWCVLKVIVHDLKEELDYNIDFPSDMISECRPRPRKALVADVY